jgi:hypothetical protein
VDFEKYDCEKRAKCPPDILKLPTRATFLLAWWGSRGSHVHESTRAGGAPIADQFLSRRPLWTKFYYSNLQNSSGRLTVLFYAKIALASSLIESRHFSLRDHQNKQSNFTIITRINRIN